MRAGSADGQRRWVSSALVALYCVRQRAHSDTRLTETSVQVPRQVRSLGQRSFPPLTKRLFDDYSHGGYRAAAPRNRGWVPDRNFRARQAAASLKVKGRTMLAVHTWEARRQLVAIWTRRS